MSSTPERADDEFEKVYGTTMPGTERPFWPSSPWVQPAVTAEDLRRVEEKVDTLVVNVRAILTALSMMEFSKADGGFRKPDDVHERVRLPRGE